MSERNSICAVLGCTAPAKWIVNFTSDDITLEVPVCAEHEPEVAPNARIIEEEPSK